MNVRDDDFEPRVSIEEREALTRIASRLADERPVPAAAFRGDLRRRVVVGESRVRDGLFSTRRLAVGSFASGAALLLLAAAGLADLGPLAPDASDVMAWALRLA